MCVTRFIGGGASSVSINLVGGSISDLYRTEKERYWFIQFHIDGQLIKYLQINPNVYLWMDFSSWYVLRINTVWISSARLTDQPQTKTSTNQIRVPGIALGPFIGGAIQRNLNWRWIYYIQIIFNVCAQDNRLRNYTDMILGWMSSHLLAPPQRDSWRCDSR